MPQLFFLCQKSLSLHEISHRKHSNIAPLALHVLTLKVYPYTQILHQSTYRHISVNFPETSNTTAYHSDWSCYQVKHQSSVTAVFFSLFQQKVEDHVCLLGNAQWNPLQVGSLQMKFWWRKWNSQTNARPFPCSKASLLRSSNIWRSLTPFMEVQLY